MPNFELALPHAIKPGDAVTLKDLSTGPPKKNEISKKAARKQIGENAIEMAELAKRLYAENTRSILLVLQGMDTAGKDGTIRWVMRGMNPTSCQVNSFKRPSEEELEHDFPKEQWSQRYQQINDFEKLLAANGTKIIKCFLHISKETQRQRLQERVDLPEKHWKFNPGDLKERKLWSDYQSAYQDALSKCNTDHAPWHIVPSDKKWYRNLVISQLLKNVLGEMNPQYPESEEDFRGIVVQ